MFHFIRIRWLYEASTAFFPSIYMSFQSQTSQQMIEMITGRILESQRIIRTLNKVPRKPKILPYMWLKYRDNGLYMTKVEIIPCIITFRYLLWCHDSNLITGRSGQYNIYIKVAECRWCRYLGQQQGCQLKEKLWNVTFLRQQYSGTNNI